MNSQKIEKILRELIGKDVQKLQALEYNTEEYLAIQKALEKFKQERSHQSSLKKGLDSSKVIEIVQDFLKNPKNENQSKDLREALYQIYENYIKEASLKIIADLKKLAEDLELEDAIQGLTVKDFVVEDVSKAYDSAEPEKLRLKVKSKKPFTFEVPEEIVEEAIEEGSEPKEYFYKEYIESLLNDEYAGIELEETVAPKLMNDLIENLLNIVKKTPNIEGQIEEVRGMGENRSVYEQEFKTKFEESEYEEVDLDSFKNDILEMTFIFKVPCIYGSLEYAYP